MRGQVIRGHEILGSVREQMGSVRIRGQMSIQSIKIIDLLGFSQIRGLPRISFRPRISSLLSFPPRIFARRHPRVRFPEAYGA
jgi:hypothetical protein